MNFPLCGSGKRSYSSDRYSKALMVINGNTYILEKMGSVCARCVWVVFPLF